jgi:hypothetical protein
VDLEQQYNSVEKPLNSFFYNFVSQINESLDLAAKTDYRNIGGWDYWEVLQTVGPPNIPNLKDSISRFSQVGI